MFKLKERTYLAQVYSCGPKMIEYIERLGINTLEDLAEQNAQELGLQIDEMLGVHRMNKLGIESLENIIEAAINYKN